eukprot:gene25723-11381_t
MRVQDVCDLLVMSLKRDHSDMEAGLYMDCPLRLYNEFCGQAHTLQAAHALKLEGPPVPIKFSAPWVAAILLNSRSG